MTDQAIASPIPNSSEQVEGFVIPPIGTPIAGEGKPTAEKEPAANPDFNSAIAMLTAALAAQQKPAEPKPDEPAHKDGSLNNFDISKLDDPILRSMATVMATVGKGLDMDRVLGKAIDRGDASLIDVNYLREKGGANAAELEVIAQGIVQAINAQSESVTKEVMTMAGGESNWNACATAFNTKAPEELRQVCVQMLDSGNSKQIQAAAKLIVEFAKGSGFVPNPNPLLKHGSASAPAAQALSKSEFQAELQKLNHNDVDYMERRDSLYQRRQLGKNTGK